MVSTVDATRRMAIHPVQAFLLAGTFTLFLAALLNDIAYWSTYQVQWTNFASWLIAGGLVLGGLALLFALVGLRHAALRRGRYLVYFLLLLASWVLGLINALVHARDAWAAMPDGLVLSVVVALLAGAATWLAFTRLRTGELA